jgi:predicted GNAT family N-acyltransferase
MNLQPVTSLTDAQIHQLHRLYQNEWWTQERTMEDVRRMLQHSDYIFGFCEPVNMNLVGFARVLTDLVFKALIFDVIVAPGYRDQGVGRLIMTRIFEHPDLLSVKHFELYCLPELIPFYERWGFSSDVGGIVLLRKERSAI